MCFEHIIPLSVEWLSPAESEGLLRRVSGETVREELKHDECISHHPLVDHLRALFAISHLSWLRGGQSHGSDELRGRSDCGGVTIDSGSAQMASSASDH